MVLLGRRVAIGLRHACGIALVVLDPANFPIGLPVGGIATRVSEGRAGMDVVWPFRDELGVLVVAEDTSLASLAARPSTEVWAGRRGRYGPIEPRVVLPRARSVEQTRVAVGVTARKVKPHSNGGQRAVRTSSTPHFRS